MIHVRPQDIAPFDFHGLRISELTPSDLTSASVAQIEVPRGIGHQKARSSKSDKIYVCLAGQVHFRVAEHEYDLHPGDVLLVPKGTWFSYLNRGASTARLLLTHTPAFDLSSEEFETA